MPIKPSELVRELSAARPPSAPPSLTPVPGLTPSQPPPPADEAEIDQLRIRLRAAQHAVRQETDRLGGLQTALERARSERAGALEAVDQAERLVTQAKRDWHHHLVVAATGGQEVTGIPAPESAQAEVDLRNEQLRSADELLAALAEEISGCENALVGLRRARDETAGALISRSPEFLVLLRNIQAAFATLRSARIAIREIGRLVTLETRLVDLSLVDQPVLPERFVGYEVNEALVGAWRDAVTQLLRDADAPLPEGAPGRPERG